MLKSVMLKEIVSKKIITLSSKKRIATALETMTQAAVSSIVVLDENNHPVGIFTENDALAIISKDISIKEPIENVMSSHPFSVIETILVHDAYLLMDAKKFRHLIVTDNSGVFIGVVTEGDFLRHLGFNNLNNIKLVYDIMSDSPLVVKHTLTLTQVISLMQKNNNEYAIVSKEKTPIGIITQRDIIKHYGDCTTQCDNTIETLLQHDIKMVDKGTSLQDAAQLMQEHGVHQLIVIDSKKNLIGLLTRHDILHAIHGAYFEFLINLIDKKSDTIESLNAKNEYMLQQHILTEKSELKLRALFEILPYGVYVMDMQSGLAIDFNSIAHNQLGYSAEEFMKLHTFDYEVIQTKEEQLAHIEKIKKEGHDLFETKFACKDGTLLDIEVNAKMITLFEESFMMVVTRDITENKKSLLEEKTRNKAFEEQSIFLHTILNTIPDLIWLKDMDGKFLNCNQKFERFANTKESQLLGKTDFDLVDQDLAQSFRDNDLAAIEAGGPRTNEEYLSFADGSYAGYFETVKTPMKDKYNNNIGVVGAAHDISEHKRQDNEISKLQALSHIGTWEWDIKNNLFYGSSEAYQIFDLPNNQAITMEEFSAIIHPLDREQHKDNLLQWLEKKDFGEMMYRIQTRDKKTKWIKSNAEFLFDSQGNALKTIGLVQDVTEYIEYEQELERLANYDALTGLANRTLLLKHLQSSIDNAKHHKKSLALLMFDLDRFKDVNDSFGHSAGDELLKRVSERLTSQLKEGDFLARLGGDEFAIVLKSFLHPEDAGILANEIIEILIKEYKLSSGDLVHIGTSAGIALFPNHGDNSETLLQHADAALYKAKEEGRGIYCYYTDELTHSARVRVDYATRLRRAIDNKEFKVYYQPQVHIATGRIIGAEALVRWDEPHEGIISPVVFIPIAEETGLINEIGEWVLNETCRQGKIWLDKGYRLTLAVNVSATQIRHQNIPEIVQKALSEHSYKAENLEIEITESAIMQREEEVVLMLHQLRAMGIRLAIDDFGTGYSSLAYLKRFPIDVLKIDKSFVDDLPFEQDDMAIVTAIIAMAKALGFQVLAEGTERIEQIEFLRERGCTLYQGYYKSKPVPADEFEKLLLANQS